VLILPKGSIKPPLGAVMNWHHPFANKLLFCLPFLATSYSTKASGLSPFTAGQIWGSTPRPNVSTENTSGNLYASNQEGVCVTLTTSQSVLVASDPIPAAQVTICMIRRKTDTTFRNGSSFSLDGATLAERCLTHLPLTGGTTYWDFGGDASPNRLSVAGVSYSTLPERWILIAGSRGMSIWQNGVKVASTATANTGRTKNTTKSFRINSYNGGSNGDAQEVNYFAAYDEQWSDEMCRWWSAEPYAHFDRPGAHAFVDFGVGGGGASAFPALSVAI
jgi:hypothetical protein